MYYTTFATLLSLLAATALAAPSNAPRAGGSDGNTVESRENSVLDIKRGEDAHPNTRLSDPDLIAKVKHAPTNVDRQNLLNQKDDHVFDFYAGTGGASIDDRGEGGRIVSANGNTFAPLAGTNLAVTATFLEACGLSTPHVHNRADELALVIDGCVSTNSIAEDGVEIVKNDLRSGQMTDFPQGAMHTLFNPTCDPATYVSVFSSSDPGTVTIAESFFGLQPDVVSATLGGLKTINGKDIESFRECIPPNLVLGIEACLEKCGIHANAKRDIREVLNEASPLE